MGASSASNALNYAERSRLRGAALVVARVLWLALTLPAIALTIAGIPYYYRQVQVPCDNSGACSQLNGVLTTDALRYLTEHGISVGVYAALHTIFFALFTAIWWVVAPLIFWHRSDEVMALVAALFLIVHGVTATPIPAIDC